MNNLSFPKFLNRIGFWFPILLASVFYFNDDSFFYHIYGNILLAITILLFLNSINKKRLSLVLEAIGVFAFNIIMFIQITHYYLFNDHIRSSTFFILFDSNSNESTEFLSMYIDFNIIVILLLLLFTSLASIIFKIKNIKKSRNFKLKVISLLIIVISLLNYKVREHTFPHIFYRAILEYQNDKKMFNEVTFDKYGGEFSEVIHASSTSNETYVLIIGESTARSHMSLYDYSRNTNPKLNKIKDELIVFKDVIAPHTHTISSLEKVLTLASHSTPNKKYDGTLIQLFNKAGFKTYWLSNQKPMGINETTTTIISKSCDEQIFVNTTDKSKDSNIFSPFEKILKQENKKKFIIIHLMGTHGAYSDRYPNSFQHFKTKPVTQFNHSKAHETINEYDNANLYNDFVVNKIIEEIKMTNSKSFALYFSDHGEDVYETIDIACHTESKGTKPMYDIPFILWRSNKFKSDDNKFKFDISRKYSSENLLYTLSELSGVSFKEFEASKSLVNKNFVERERPILNKIDYDIYFKKNK